VVQVLMKVVDGTTVDDAVNIMQEAHLTGVALVAQCAQVGRALVAQPDPGCVCCCACGYFCCC